MIDKKKYKVSIDVDLIIDDKDYLIATTEESKKLFCQSLYGFGKSIEEAEKSFWLMVKFNSEFNNERSKQLDKYKFFQCGNWKHIGGTWFTILGISVYFRYGLNMKYGKYIPFTKLNISITNYWKIKN